VTRAASSGETDAASYVLELVGLAVPGAAEHLRRVGAVLADHPCLAPTRCGPSDPPTVPVTDLATDLAALGEEQADRPQAMVHLAGPERGESGTVAHVADPFRDHPPGFVRPSKMELTLVPDEPRALGELLAGLAEATDACYGFVSSRPHLVQLRGPFGSEQRRRHGPAPSGGQPPAWQPPPFQALEMALPDVFWVQYLGPAFVELWGEDRAARAGSTRRRLANGGYVVWACDDPPAQDPDVKSPEAYPWKASVYDALGAEPFVRHDRAWNGFGVHVPLMTRHAAAAGPTRRDPSISTLDPVRRRNR
jgi:hypothetical protein